MKPVYVQGIDAATVPAERKAGRPMTEDEMLLEIDIRLQIAANIGEVEIGEDKWWSSGAADPEEDAGKPGRAMHVKVPRSALEPQGREGTAQNLRTVTEMTMHARLMHAGVPDEFKVGDPKADATIPGYIAGAAADQIHQLALTGRLQPSQSNLPEDQREPLFLDLEYFDEMITAEHGKGFNETDAYRAATALEAKYFDPRTSAEAAAAWKHISEPETPQPVRGAGRPVGGANPATGDRRPEPSR